MSAAFDPSHTPDPIVHEPARLRILTILSVTESAEFLYLLNETRLTKGNLSTHLSRLADAGYIEIEKDFVARKPRTMARLTSAGRRAFERYREYLQALLEATEGDFG